MKLANALRTILPLLLVATFLSAQPEASGPHQGLKAAAAPELAPAIALSHRVERLKEAFQTRDEAKIKVAVQDVDLLRRTYGTLDMQPMVDALCLWARQQTDPELGLLVTRNLERWSPKHPGVLAANVELMRKEGPKGYVLSMPYVLELNRLRLAHPTHRWLWMVQHMGWVRLMVTVLLWGWTLTMVLRYRNVLRYLWEEPLSRRGMSSFAMALVGMVTLAWPVLFGLDLSVAALFALWLLAPFLHASEVQATIVVMLLQLAHPALALMEPQAGHAPDPSIVALQLQPQPSRDAAWARGLPPQDQEFVKGWQQLQLQEWAKAEATYAALLHGHPDRARVLNNLGVAEYQQNKKEEAQKHFDAANMLDAKSAEILLNQSVLAFEKLDSALGLAKQEAANQAAPQTYERIMAALQSRKEQRTFAAPLPDTPERTQALKKALGAAESVYESPQRGGVLIFWLVVPILALVMFMLRLRGSVKSAHPTQCIRCGEPFHTTDSPDFEVCSKCHHLFVLKDSIHGESRKRKVDQVAGHQGKQRWIHRALIILLPGTDLCFLGETRKGILEFCFLCFALGIVFATGRSILYPGEILPDPASTWLPLGLGLLAVLFLRSWLKLLPRRRI